MNKWKSNWFRFQLRTPVEDGSDLGGANPDALDLGFLGLDEEPVVDEQEAASELETDQAATVQGEGQEADPAAVAVADQQVAQADPAVEAQPDPAAAVQPDPVAQPAPAVVEQAAVPDQAQQQAQHKADEEAYRTSLETQYSLSEEDADKFFEDPNSVLPKLAANLHMQVLQHVLQVVSQALPNEIASYQARSSKQVELETQFSTRWPDLDLKKPDVSAAIANAVTLAKKALPNADTPTLIERVGLITHSLLGNMPPAAGQQQAPVQAPAPAAKPKPAQMASAAGQVRQAAPAQDSWNAWLDDLESDK